MAANNMMKTLMRDISKLRAEEADDDCWFILPDETDDETDWTNFSVEIEAPSKYIVSPVPGEGERDCPYSGGMFRVHIKVPSTYPEEAPKVQFGTRIWHPQVNRETGEPCIDVLKDQWRPGMTIKDVLIIVRQLIGSPSKSDSVNTEAASEMADIEAFEKHASDDTKRFASY